MIQLKFQYFNRFLISLVLVLNHPIISLSQIVLSPTYSNPYELKVNDLYTVQIINSGIKENLKLLIDVTAGVQIYHSETAPFLCETGVSSFTLNNFQIKQSIFSNSPIYEITKNTGLFPAGDYYICYKLINLTTLEEMHNCINYEVSPITPILLLNPSQNSTVNTLYPQLMWLAPTPILSNNFPYTIRIVELQANQSCYEAIKRNFEVFKVSDYNQTNILYPMNAMPLEYNKNYCWQVVTQVNRKVDSEVWGFTPKFDSTEEDAKIIFFDNYVIPKNAPNTSTINIKNQLRIQFEEEFPIKQMFYEVLDINQKPIISNDQSLVIAKGANKFILDLQQSNLFINRSYYTLKISGENSKDSHFVFFRYFKREQ